nr:histone deacetylase 14 [Tanacetum cinerariifolium]
MLHLLERATLSWIFKRRKSSRMKTGLQWMQNTNFFRAFTALTSVPTIYLQQFWDTFMFKAKTGTYHFQLDEDWFTLDANLLREALDITPIDQAHQFVSPLLGRNHKIHQRSGSPLNLAEDDLSLGNPKFVTKGEIDEVFGMQIPNELIMDNIRNAPYYNAYMEMVAKHNQKMLGKKCSKVFPLLDPDQKQEIRRFKEFLKRES